MLSTRAGHGDYGLFWGDFHKHLTGPGADIDRIDSVLRDATIHLDVTTVLCYPFKWFRKGREGGIREETVGHDPEYDGWWKQIQRAAEAHNEPGEFVTFPAYEWHGNRTEWGDHNVIFRAEGGPISDAWDLPELYDILRQHDALALPHHTAYQVGNRGKDWSVHDPALSPVMEVYSSHGSSESPDSPIDMASNADMGPRTSGGTFRDGLDRGCRVGAIASNDGPGLPGTWNRGVTGLWATELSREGIWEALTARRTYGTTGDRIQLWWAIDGHPMGSVVPAGPALQGRVEIDCPRPLDRIDLIHDGAVVDSYDHRLVEQPVEDTVFRVLVEVGWGPNGDYGDFESPVTDWAGTITTRNGTILGVQPRFVGFDQTYQLTDDGCEFDLRTVRGNADRGILPEGDTTSERQGFILEIEPQDTTEIVVSLDDRSPIRVPLDQAREETTLVALLEESRERLDAEFELDDEAIDNPDVVYHNARKIRLSRAHPRSACAASVSFDLDESEPSGYYYVRARQVDGQVAWSSPIWVE